MLGRFSLRARLLFGVVLLAAVGLAVADAATYVSLRSFQIEGFDPGDFNTRFDVNRQGLKLDRLEAFVGRGQVAGTAEVGFREGLPLSTDLSLHDVELAELLRKLTLPHVWVMLRTGGKVQVKGTLLPLQLGGEANLDLSDFAVLDRDQTTVSRDYILNLAGSRYFNERSPVIDYKELDLRMRAGEISMAVEMNSSWLSAPASSAAARRETMSSCGARRLNPARVFR